MLYTLPKVTQVTHGRTEIWNQVLWLQKIHGWQLLGFDLLTEIAFRNGFQLDVTDISNPLWNSDVGDALVPWTETRPSLNWTETRPSNYADSWVRRWSQGSTGRKEGEELVKSGMLNKLLLWAQGSGSRRVSSSVLCVSPSSQDECLPRDVKPLTFWDAQPRVWASCFGTREISQTKHHGVSVQNCPTEVSV